MLVINNDESFMISNYKTKYIWIVKGKSHEYKNLNILDLKIFNDNMKLWLLVLSVLKQNNKFNKICYVSE